MADFSRIGRNNKNRGRNFERQVAEKLGWTRVPYSGAIKEWGGADVVDGFYSRSGFWAAECKTQQPGPEKSISIKHKWVGQMLGGGVKGRHPIIITKNVGSRDAYVFMLEDTYDWLVDFIGMKDEDPVPCSFTHDIPLRGKSYNFVVKQEHLPEASDGFTILRVGPDRDLWYVIHLDDFEFVVTEYNVMRKEVKPNE
jgi:hypothetical protein